MTLVQADNFYFVSFNRDDNEAPGDLLGSSKRARFLILFSVITAHLLGIYFTQEYSKKRMAFVPRET